MTSGKKKGKSIYLTVKDIRMINNAIDTQIIELQESYERDGEECDLFWMDEYRRLKDLKFKED